MTMVDTWYVAHNWAVQGNLSPGRSCPVVICSPNSFAMDSHRGADPRPVKTTT
jgi:hypothetical protein